MTPRVLPALAINMMSFAINGEGDFACAVAKAPYGTMFSSAVDGTFAPLSQWGLMGFRGVAMHAGVLHDLVNWEVPPSCFLVDDAYASYVLLNRSGYHLRQLLLRNLGTFSSSAKLSTSISKVNNPSVCVRTLAMEGARRLAPAAAAMREPRLSVSS